MSSIIRNLSLTANIIVLAACSQADIQSPNGGTTPKADSALEINYDKFTLENGLDVIFHICLLYTSPSPRDGLLSRMPSSA